LQKHLKCKDQDLASFLSGLLDYDPHSRLTPKEALFHPFISKLFPFRLIFKQPTSWDPMITGSIKSGFDE
jgi:serine/threonine protein kinase